MQFRQGFKNQVARLFSDVKEYHKRENREAYRDEKCSPKLYGHSECCGKHRLLRETQRHLGLRATAIERVFIKKGLLFYARIENLKVGNQIYKYQSLTRHPNDGPQKSFGQFSDLWFKMVTEITGVEY